MLDDDDEQQAEIDQARRDRLLARILTPLFCIAFLIMMIWINSKHSEELLAKASKAPLAAPQY